MAQVQFGYILLLHKNSNEFRSLETEKEEDDDGDVDDENFCVESHSTTT